MLDFDFHQRAGGGISAHDRVFRGGPGEDEAWIESLAAHGVVSSAERSANNHHNLRHDGVRNRIHHFCARLDDAAPFGVAPNHEAVYVVEKDERDQALVAVHDEASGLLGGLGVNNAAELDALVAFMVSLVRVKFLIGNNADGEASDASIPADQRFPILGLVLVKAAFIHNARENFFHVVRARGRGIVSAVDLFGLHRWLHGLFAIPERLAAVTPFFNQRTDAGDTRLVIRLAKVDGAADGGVHRGATQFFGGDFLPDGGLH